MNKKAVFVIAFNNFKDEELFVCKDVLEKADWHIFVASTDLGIANGSDGGQVNIDFLINDIKVNDFDAFVFIGGPGMVKNAENISMHSLAQKIINDNKILAAICIAPIILAKAGVLKNKKATVWSSSMNKQPIDFLKSNGAIYKNDDVVVDGNIITANGPDATKEFGEKIISISK